MADPNKEKCEKELREVAEAIVTGLGELEIVRTPEMPMRFTLASLDNWDRVQKRLFREIRILGHGLYLYGGDDAHASSPNRVVEALESIAKSLERGMAAHGGGL